MTDMIIAIVGVKGGTAKTTSALYLAHALSCPVVDTDPQASATEWAEVAEAAGLPLAVPVHSLPTAKLAGRLPSHSHLVLDTPPGDAGIITAAVDVADFVVLPVAPTALEVSRVWPALDLVRAAGKPAAILLCRTRHTRSVDEVDAALTDDGARVFKTRIPLREALALAWGKPITEFHGYDHAATELVREGQR